MPQYMHVARRHREMSRTLRSLRRLVSGDVPILKGHPSVALEVTCPDCFPDTELLFLFLLIAPVLTSITPIRASNAHGRGWIANAGFSIRRGHNRHWHDKAQRGHPAEKGKSPAARNHFGFELFSHHNLL